MKVVVKINGVEILVNARAEEVETIEIVISDETVGEERRETREITEVRAETVVERQEDEEGSEAEPHYCNVNCSCKFNQVNNSK